MQYNMNYEFSAVIILTVLLIFHKLQYTKNTKQNIAFRKLTISMYAATIVDLVTAYTIVYSNVVPLWLNYLLNAAYYVLTPLCPYYLLQYAENYFQDKTRFRIIDSLNQIVIVGYIALAITTPFTKWMFYFDENRIYTHGPLYIVLFLVPMFFVMTATTVIIANKKLIKRNYFVSLLAFVVVAEGGTALQLLVFGNTLISYFAGAVAAMILYFAMETPDYDKLMTTMEELEQARKDAEFAKQEADSANAAKSQFLANMSHEIRTPINGILGINEIALGDTEDEGIKKYLYDIQDAGKSLLALVNEVLDVSKIESGKMELINQPYNVAGLIYSVQNIIRFKVEEKKLDLQIVNDTEIPAILIGDESHIRQIMTNLLSNAVKYTDVGTITLSIAFQREGDQAGNLLISVKDTGMGIKPEDQKKIFGSFERFDLKKNRNVEGTGLGLHLTHGLVQLMNGTIELKSLYGVGSLFSVSIPQEIFDETPMGDYQKFMEQHMLEKPEEVVVYAPKAKVLVVDDVELNLKVFEGLLKSTAIQIQKANSGMKALELAKDTAFDLIFMDHMMPEMDGVEAFHAIREQQGGKNVETPIIVLTANAVNTAKEEYTRIGFTDYLAKPIDSSLLKRQIISYLPKNLMEKKA